MRRLRPFLLALLVVAVSGPARAELVDSSPMGFFTRSESTVSAPPDSVYRALVGRIADWWDPAHTFSGDARNLTLDARPGGCFCEALPNNGGVRHLTVVFASPSETLRLVGALGPLQASGLAGSLTWSLQRVEGGTKVGLDYSVGGYFQGGLQAIAPAVDAVLLGQLLRMKRYVETGKPDGE